MTDAPKTLAELAPPTPEAVRHLLAILGGPTEAVGDAA